MYQLRVLQKARNDMQKSADWYNEQQAGVGNRFLSQVVVTFKLIASGPLLYEEKFSKKFRFAKLKDFPHLVVFKIKGEFVIVNAVFHTSRDPKRFV